MGVHVRHLLVCKRTLMQVGMTLDHCVPDNSSISIDRLPAPLEMLLGLAGRVSGSFSATFP